MRNETTQAELLTRRQFLKIALGFSFLATLGGVLTPTLGYIWPPARGAQVAGGRVFVSTRRELGAGQAKKVQVGNQPVLVINTGTTIKAFSAICTHLACIVEWNESGQFIQCPCHDGRFDTNGQVISGPPPAPLPEFKVGIEGDDIYVMGA